MEKLINVGLSFVQLSQGKVATIDTKYNKDVLKYKWHAMKGTQKKREVWYAGNSKWDSKIKKTRKMRMHRYIMGVYLGRTLEPEEQIDHIDGDGLKNNISNLRVVSNRENCQNRHDKIYSKYPGVTWNKSIKKWTTNIFIENKAKRLGAYESEEEAYAEYMKANELIKEDKISEIFEIWPSKEKTSKYKGIHWNAKKNKWIAQIYKNGKQKYLGIFKDEEKALQAYRNAEKEFENQTVLV